MSFLYTEFNQNNSNIAFRANVGIGTTLPISTLHVHGDAIVTSTVGVGTTSSQVYKVIVHEGNIALSSNSEFQLDTWSNSATSLGNSVMVMTPNGNVGFGESPATTTTFVAGNALVSSTLDLNSEVDIINQNTVIAFQSVNGTNVSVGMQLPSSISDCIGWYTGDSWTGTRWNDISGSGNHITSINGSVATTTFSNSTLKYLYGNSLTTGLTFPSTILPPSYTLFHVARSPTSLTGRIFDGVDENWLSGFDIGSSGVAFHGSTAGYITNTVNKYGNGWVVSTDQRNVYRGQGTNWTSSSFTSGVAAQLSINNGLNKGAGTLWNVAEVIVYRRELSIEEIGAVESYLINKYRPFLSLISNTITPVDVFNISMANLPILSSESTGNVGIGTTTADAKIVCMGYVSYDVPYLMGEFVASSTGTIALTAIGSVNMSVTNSTNATAQHSGLYLVSFSAISTSSTGNVNIHIRRNNNHPLAFTNNETNATGFHYRTASVVTYLDVGDYVCFFTDGTIFQSTAAGNNVWRYFGVSYVGGGTRTSTFPIVIYDFTDTRSYTGTSSTSVYDISGNTFTATFNTAPTYNANPKYITITSGTVSAISSSTLVDITKGFTLEIMFMFTQNAGNAPVLWSYAVGTDNNGIQLQLDSSNFLYIFNTNGSTILKASVACLATTWNHYVFTSAGDMYLNGTNISTTGTLGTFTNASRTFSVGDINRTRSMIGNYAFVELHGCVLSQSEVATIYTSLRSSNQYNWSPLYISGLQNYYSADTGLSVSGGMISQWNDLSGNNRHATQATAGNQPAYHPTALNGFPMVNFQGVNGRLLNVASTTFTSFTIAYVVQVSLKSSANSVVLAYSSYVAGYSRVYYGTSDRTLYQMVHNNVVVAGGFNFTDNVPHIVVITGSISASVLTRNFYVNGTLTSTDSQTISGLTALNFTSFYIGNDYLGVSETLNGGLGSLALYNQSLTNNNRQILEGFLAWKWWGNGTVLPSNHPFKNVAP
jgi:hypothetical protein